MKNIVTITLNPAIDLYGSLDKVNIGGLSLVNQSSLYAGGKGINVARVLHDLGAKVTVTGFLGIDNQDEFCQLFRRIDVNDQFVRVKGATRVNIKLVEHDKTVSDINFPGLTVSKEDKDHFETILFGLMQRHDVFIFAGSLPKGISTDELVGWIESLKKQGKKVVLDTSRDALLQGIQSNPWLVKPNEEELGYLVNQSLSSIDQCIQASSYLDDFVDGSNTIDNFVISKGSDGVLWRRKNHWLYATPPKMDIASTVGAGDTLVAGFCWAYLNDWEEEQTLSFATALSASAVSQVGVGVPDIEMIFNLQSSVSIKKLKTINMI